MQPPSSPPDPAAHVPPAAVTGSAGPADAAESAESGDAGSPSTAARLRKPTARDVLGGAMMGVAAVMHPKADPTAHWSTAPKITIVAESRQQRSGDGPDLELPEDLEPPPPIDARRRRTSWWTGRPKR